MLGYRAVSRTVRALAGGERGSMAVETALIAPVVIVLLLGTVDAVRFTMTVNKIDRIASTTADLVTRQRELRDGLTVREGNEIGAFFQAANVVAEPIHLEDAGRVYLSGVANEDGRGARVLWQRTGDYGLDANSGIGGEGELARLPADMTLKPGESTVVAEVFYEFVPATVSGDLFFDAGAVRLYRRRCSGRAMAASRRCNDRRSQSCP